MSRARTLAAIYRSLDAEFAPWGGSNVLPDEHGNQRYREAERAARHLASLTPERRAQLEREWSGK